MAITTRLTQLLGVEHPIVLGAMDLVADARLTIAVSDAGGFGILGGGYGNSGWLSRELPPLVAARKSRGLRFGIGFITWSLSRQPRLLDQALDAKPDIVWLSFGDPSPFVDKIKESGARVMCQIQSVGMAREAVEKGADILVAQGTEAGGHGVSRGSMTLTPAVVDAVGHKVPVVTAGGIGDGRGLAGALMLGADGIVFGTRLYASQEAAGHPAAKARIVNASGDDTIRGVVFDISRNNVWPAPFTGRCLTNDHTRRWAGRELQLMQNLQEEGALYLDARERGDFDIAAVIAGEVTDLIHDLPTAGEIVKRTAAQAEELLENANQRLATTLRPARG